VHKLALAVGLVASLSFASSLAFGDDTYTIRSGDSMSRIASHLGCSVADLQKANPTIKKPNDLKIGHKLHIPGAAAAVAPAPAAAVVPAVEAAAPAPAEPAPAPVAATPAPAEVAPAPAPAPAVAAEPAPAPAPAVVAAPAPAPAAAPAEAAPAPAPAPVVAEAPAGGLTTSRSAEANSGGVNRPVGYVLLGTGVAAVVVSAVLGGMAVGQLNQVNSTNSFDTSHSLKSDQEAAAAGIVLLGGLTAAMIGANLLFPESGK
jgi:LysM repeat protein